MTPLQNIRRRQQMPAEFDRADCQTVEYIRANKLTMVSAERLFATMLACRHVVATHVAGDFVECGVWRGGNALAAADIFGRSGQNRTVWMFDTFAGMTEPTVLDRDAQTGRPAISRFKETPGWCLASRQEVEQTFESFPGRKEFCPFQMVEGRVEETLRGRVLPERISVLRLDTDWYESTKIELEVLWPRLEYGGILIVDDYGKWTGARQAVDEFFSVRPRPFFHFIDDTGRMAVKP